MSISRIAVAILLPVLAAAVCTPVGATETSIQPLVAISPRLSDPIALPIDMSKQMEEAHKLQLRRDPGKPIPPDRLARMHHHRGNKIYILGGSTAMPM